MASVRLVALAAVQEGPSRLVVANGRGSVRVALEISDGRRGAAIGVSYEMVQTHVHHLDAAGRVALLSRKIQCVLALSSRCLQSCTNRNKSLDDPNVPVGRGIMQRCLPLVICELGERSKGMQGLHCLQISIARRPVQWRSLRHVIRQSHLGSDP